LDKRVIAVTEHCPCCDSGDIEGTDHDYDLDSLEIEYRCVTCNSRWSAYFKLKPHSWEIEFDGKLNEIMDEFGGWVCLDTEETFTVGPQYDLICPTHGKQGLDHFHDPIEVKYHREAEKD
jgi:hypothetical protein